MEGNIMHSLEFMGAKREKRSNRNDLRLVRRNYHGDLNERGLKQKCRQMAN